MSTQVNFWEGKRVAVTGATGFLGSHLVAALVDLGAVVTVLRRDRLPESPIASAWRNSVIWVEGSIEDLPLLERTLSEYETEVVFHLAAQSQVGVANRHPTATFEANIRGTWTVLEGTRRIAGLQAVVVASSDKAYGDQGGQPYTEEMPLLGAHPYDVSKACSDLVARSYALTYSLPVAITRCGNLYGAGDMNWNRIIPGTIRSLVRGERPVIRSDGTPTRDYLHVKDAVDGYLGLAEHLACDQGLAGSAFNLSHGSPKSVLDVVTATQRVLGSRLDPIIAATATGEIDRQTLDSGRARRLIGWDPRIPFEQGLEMTCQWYCQYLGQADPARPAS